MTIVERVSSDVTILDIDGGITLGPGAEDLHAAVEKLLQDGRKSILLNLDRVPVIDSAGLGRILALKKAALMAQAKVKLLRPHGKVYAVLAETSLAKVFECFDAEAPAIESFHANP